MAFTYQQYSDNAETLAAKKKKEEAEANKPGDFSYSDYTQSDTVTQAQNLLNQHLANQPGAYQSQWQSGLDDVMNKILNREKFTYDLNGDMLYQQYKDQYVNQGKMAMMDTMGQAAAMTGGYGNSYAQTVGQQTYQGYLQQLNDKVPELYQMALDQYNREGEELYNQYGLYADRDDRDYGRYRDTVSDWQIDRDYLTGRYDTEADRDYGRYVDGRDFAYSVHRDDVADYYTALDMLTQEFWNQRNFGYGQYSDNRDLAYTDHRNTIEDQQWQQEFNEAQRQFNVQQTASSSGGGGGGGNDNNGGNKKVSLSTIQNKCATFENNDDLLEYLGARVDDGSISEEKMDELYSKYAITQNLNTSGSRYAYGTGASGGYNIYTQNLYPGK